MSRKKNILFVTAFATLYGANKSLLNTVDELLARGFGVSVIIQADGTLKQELQKRRCSVYTINFKNEVSHSKRQLIRGVAKMLVNLYLAIKARSVFSKEKIDVIHSNSSVHFFGAYLSFLYRKPHIWHIREFLKKDYNLYYSFGNRYFYWWVQRASDIICISKAVAESRFLSKKHRCNVLYNGILNSLENVEGSSIDEEESDDAKEFNIGIVGKVFEGKNQLEAIKAFVLFYEKVKAGNLLIVGEGNVEYIQMLKTVIYENGLEERVSFLGHQENMGDIYKKLSVLLMCSRNEGLGRVTIEAMASSVCVIGFDGGGTREIIRNNVDGLLYENGEFELATKLQNLHEDRSLRHRLRDSARKRAYDMFSVKSYIDRLEKVYNGVVKN